MKVSDHQNKSEELSITATVYEMKDKSAETTVLSSRKRKALDALKIDMVADTFSPGGVGSRRGGRSSRNEVKVDNTEDDVGKEDVEKHSPPIRSRRTSVKSIDKCDESKNVLSDSH